MTHPRLAGLLAAVLLVTSCSGGDDESPAPSTAPPTSAETTTTGEIRGDDGSLDPYLLSADDLPAGFAPTTDGVDETITAFCAGEDATAGLRATARSVLGFQRTPEGAAVMQLVFRFEGTGAAELVAAAEEILSRCSDVPDATGLAFAYEPVAPGVAEALAGVDSSASRYGVSAGSGNLTLNVAVVHTGDVGQLVAALGIQLPREELDALAATAFAAAVERATAATG